MERPYASNLASIRARDPASIKEYVAALTPGLALFEPQPLFEPGFYTSKYSKYARPTVCVVTQAHWQRREVVGMKIKMVWTWSDSEIAALLAGGEMN